MGHSDGATAALIAASRDWDVSATIAVSASVAPAYLVNHVAPQNLLLIYGDSDRFVLDHTDRSLIWNATRGVLDDAGRVGSFADGTARQLVRIPGAGHINVLSSGTSRSEVLTWLRSAFGLHGKVTLSSPRPRARHWPARSCVGGSAAR